MTIRTLTEEIWLPQPRNRVFAYFSDVRNLEELTPPWLRFRILTPPPISMEQGTRIAYRIRWRWVPLRWLTEISAWEPPHRFVDRQLQGPYRQWIHEHTFEEKDGGTLMRDRVEYAAPGWIAEPLLERFLVGPDVRRIFAYRSAKMRQRFSSESHR